MAQHALVARHHLTLPWPWWQHAMCACVCRLLCGWLGGSPPHFFTWTAVVCSHLCLCHAQLQDTPPYTPIPPPPPGFTFEHLHMHGWSPICTGICTRTCTPEPLQNPWSSLLGQKEASPTHVWPLTPCTPPDKDTPLPPPPPPLHSLAYHSTPLHTNTPSTPPHLSPSPSVPPG